MSLLSQIEVALKKLRRIATLHISIRLLRIYRMLLKSLNLKQAPNMRTTEDHQRPGINFVVKLQQQMYTLNKCVY